MNWKHQRCGIAVPQQHSGLEGGRGHLGPRSTFMQHFNPNCNPNTGFDRKVMLWMPSGKRCFTQEGRTVSSSINWRETSENWKVLDKKRNWDSEHASSYTGKFLPQYICCQFSCITLIEVRVGHSNPNNNRAEYFTSGNHTIFQKDGGATTNTPKAPSSSSVLSLSPASCALQLLQCPCVPCALHGWFPSMLLTCAAQLEPMRDDWAQPHPNHHTLCAYNTCRVSFPAENRQGTSSLSFKKLCLEVILF